MTKPQRPTPESLERDHAAHVLAVQNAVSNLIIKLGYPSEVVFEGAVKGACAAVLAEGASTADVGVMLEDFAEAIRNVPDDGPAKH